MKIYCITDQAGKLAGFAWGKTESEAVSLIEGGKSGIETNWRFVPSELLQKSRETMPIKVLKKKIKHAGMEWKFADAGTPPMKIVSEAERAKAEAVNSG